VRTEVLLYGKKGTNPPLPDFETRAPSLRCCKKFEPFLMNAFFITRIVTYFTVETCRAFASRWINTLSCWNIPQVYEYIVESRDSHLRKAESQVLILKKQFQVCIFKQLFKSFVDNFRSSQSLSKNDEKKSNSENKILLRYVR